MALNKLRSRYYVEHVAKKQVLVLLCIVVLSFLLLIISTYFISDVDYESISRGRTEGVNFGVVVDCGSTGTRAHIFKWSTDQSKTIVPRIEPLRDGATGRAITKHITPGLSTLQDKPDQASDYMEPIMQFICDSVPPVRHLDTPIFFMATAGMRLLDDNIQKRILADISHDLRVKFDFPRIKSQVITGEYEGLYSWLSLNLDKVYNDSKDPLQDASIGMIEMGGASIQVAFVLTPEVENSIIKNLDSIDAIKAFRDEQVTVRLTGDRYVKLFVTTFLGLGWNSAREFEIDLLIQDHYGDSAKSEVGLHSEDIKLSLADPCLTKGSKELISRPFEVIKNRENTVSSIMRSNSAAFRVTLEGLGDLSSCSKLLERVIRTSRSSKLNCDSKRKSCPMSLLGEKFIPYQHYSFAGLSEMYFTTNEMLHSSGRFNKSEFEREAKQICATSYGKLLEKYSTGGLVQQQDRVIHQCFRASWLLAVLDKNSFMMPDDYAKFNTIERLNGREIDWTLGAFVSEIALNNRTST